MITYNAYRKMSGNYNILIFKCPMIQAFQPSLITFASTYEEKQQKGMCNLDHCSGAGFKYFAMVDWGRY